TEGLGLGIAGGLLGTILAYAFIERGDYSLSAEGMSINFHASREVIITGFAIAAGVGLVAGLVPALRAGRREIAQCFRSV
ncbi:MAG: FtsX-like permease family protein, partial [bacterium]